VTILPMVCFDILNVCHSTMLSRGRSPSWYKHACSTVMEYPLVSVKYCYAEGHDIAYRLRWKAYRPSSMAPIMPTHILTNNYW
jgi:hypothetical protein